MKNEYIPIPAEIIEIKKETSNTSTLTLKYTNNKSDKKILWVPGQFMMVNIFAAGEAAISISNINDELINMTIRNVGSVTNSILSLKKGNTLGIRGPFGKGWPLQKAKGKDILIIGGGMGIVPLKGVINYILNNRKDFGHLEIIYGAKTPQEMVFKYDFEKWRKIKNSNLHFTADEVTGETPFECKIGLVTSCFPNMKTHHRNALVFVCGPEIMMRFTAKCLETIGFADKQIYLSLERRMKCGIGKCGHCQIGKKYVCKDGPVFNYDNIKPFIRPL